MALLQILFPILLGVLTAVGLAFIWMKFNNRTEVTARAMMLEAEGSIAFLFDDEVLADATPRARALMADKDDRRSDWENFVSLMSARYPNLRSQCRNLASHGKRRFRPNDGSSGWIDAEYWNGLARLTLIDPSESPVTGMDPLTAAAMEHELETLRSIGEDAPQLIWKRDAEGVLVWANRAYFEMSETLHPVNETGIRPWPPRDVFPDIQKPQGTAPIIELHKVEIPGAEKPSWFEVTALKRGRDSMYFAVDASAVVYAQEAQKNFVQTLTKTFAHLSVGLAIFDSERRLVLFNPALVDLTHLVPEFLIGRPDLFSFIDRLRDKNMIPEPKNYISWRDQTIALENAASEGSYLETWSLPNGQTYRVTGKPHPNGAIAFLFEDISDEISLTRRFRSQIDSSAAVIDNLPDAVAVFSSTGALVMSNRAYRQIWGGPPENTLETRNFRDELESWKAVSAPSPVWIKLQNIFATGGGETAWNGSVWLDTHVEITCHYAPLPNGQHQVTFVLSNMPDDASAHTEPTTLSAAGGLSN